MPELGGIGEHHQPEPHPERGHQELGENEQFPAVHDVGDEAGPGSDEELRTKLECHHDTEGRGVLLGQDVVDQPVLRGALHPGPDVRHHRADEPQAVVADTEGPEGAHRAAAPSPARSRPN